MIVRKHELFDRLMDATSISRLLGRPRTTVLAHCEPIACDVETHRLLYAARHSSIVLGSIRKRERKAA